MKSEDYAQGDAFQAEKRTLFSTEWLPLCAEAQIARPGDFLSATVGGWGVFGVRDKEGTVRVLRNACRHQNMQVVGTPSGNCESFRCRFHGWTYDLQGRFLGAPPPVAPKDPQAPDLHLASLATSIASGLVFFSLAAAAAPPDLGGPLPAYRGTLTTEIACNWKVCVEHLLAEHTPSPDFAWHWPLLAVRRAGRTRDHGTGRAAHLSAHAASDPCVRWRTPMNTSRPPPPSSTSANVSRPTATRASRQPTARWWQRSTASLPRAYAQDRTTT